MIWWTQEGTCWARIFEYVEFVHSRKSSGRDKAFVNRRLRWQQTEKSREDGTRFELSRNELDEKQSLRRCYAE